MSAALHMFAMTSCVLLIWLMPKPKGLGMHPSLAPGYLVAYMVQCIPYSFLCNTSAHCLIQRPHQGLMRFFT